LRPQRYLVRFGICYVILDVIFAIALGEIAFRPPRVPVDERMAAVALAQRFGAVLQDVTQTAPDGIVLRAWFARPAKRSRAAYGL
jgi:hypothetical protein